MNYKEAKNTEVFIIRNERIVATNLYDHVMESAEISYGQNGLTRKRYVAETRSANASRKECNGCQHTLKTLCTASNECEYAKRWELRTRLHGYSHVTIDSFESKERAEQELFNYVEMFDFKEDKTKDAWYCYDKSWAVMEMAERNNLDILTQTSILKHRAQLDEAKAAKLAAHNNAKHELSEKEKQIMYDIAEMYSTMIDPVEGETYKDTCKRLSNAVGERIGSRVFHMAVKIRRDEY